MKRTSPFGITFMQPKPIPESRANYRYFQQIATRWSDNDVYGHVNNVVYYSWFDTAVNSFLIEKGVLDIGGGSPIGLVVETGCNYFASLAFPEPVEIGVRVTKVSRSSVRYELGVFDADHQMAAKGHFVHVYVDTVTRRPSDLPERLIRVLEALK